MTRQGVTRLLLWTVMLAAAPSASADNDNVLRFDPPSGLADTATFDLDDPLQPTPSSFRLLDSAPLSSGNGERWAVVTLENTAGGQRLLRDDYLVAEFANGDRRKAGNLEGKLAAGEQKRMTVFFGFHRFPILRLFTAN